MLSGEAEIITRSRRDSQELTLLLSHSESCRCTPQEMYRCLLFVTLKQPQGPDVSYCNAMVKSGKALIITTITTSCLTTWNLQNHEKSFEHR
ncbi:hypothetical protein F511_22198 [Dorcoceras hygrometricum]|uniref:Uncharacterized protein n=1 Tax=Dorcoceras hygrometricum TaxID=472368 RepID=A0A2Z7CGX9_9LAMI|nr:hypothetical protein F511_22198 [Dorcoceras hygrometricum]